jgi:membrane associated rhomboid family serine protease
VIPISDSVRRTRTPVITWALCVANVLIFVSELRLPEPQLVRALYLYGLVPLRYEDLALVLERGVAEAAPFVTSLFLHGGWLHLVSNLWILMIFGDNVEDRMGASRYLAFYLLCGIAAGVVHLLTNAGSGVPAIGASGAIAGVLGGYFALFPRARVLTIVPIFFLPVFVEVPALVFLGLWFVTQFLSGTAALVSEGAGGGIAWWAHVGGFLAGIVLHRAFLDPRRRPYASRA